VHPTPSTQPPTILGRAVHLVGAHDVRAAEAKIRSMGISLA
jgi:hypothetical protein